MKKPGLLLQTLCLLRERMFKEPWFDISEYPEDHQVALEQELESELASGHVFFGSHSSAQAKCEDREDILV